MPDNKIVSVGRGLVGRAWAIAFARAGHDVALVGRKGVAADEAWSAIDTNLRDLERVGEIESATAVRTRIIASPTRWTAPFWRSRAIRRTGMSSTPSLQRWTALRDPTASSAVPHPASAPRNSRKTSTAVIAA